MTTFYNHSELEKKWQQRWENSDLNKAQEGAGKKQYILDMFPYPSAEGLHVGHPESYTATDIAARYLRLKGYNVLHPVGFDAFGLPAENFAIAEGIHPRLKTQENIKNFTRQIKTLGFSYDWSREVDTSSPEYYKWTQWLFLQLYKKGLAYKKQAPVNWCESCKTVLANEQVVDGKCERCEYEVRQKDLEQWFFRITDYADELLSAIDSLDWSDALKAAQRNWIGKSEGALIEFQIPARQQLRRQAMASRLNFKFPIQVFTTRPDTLFGATYLVLAPEHPLTQNFRLRPLGYARGYGGQVKLSAKGRLALGWKTKNLTEINEYIEKAKTKNKLERTDLAKEKTGVELKGIKAINPATKKEIPIWIADYVLMDYGTGAIMAVPAHDGRDYEFAKKYNLPIVEVITKNKEQRTKNKDVYSEEGVLTNSGKFDGLNSKAARKKITKFVGGKKQVQYKIRDWLISRQRYWGAPIPIIYCGKCGLVPVPEKDLPVLLPDDVDFRPTGESPLSRSKKFHQVKCPKCGRPARRESDTMDTFVCSSWYFLRYCDPHNQKAPFSKKLVKYWMPVDLYIGGMEHAVGHLIYARFIYKVLTDLGYIPRGLGVGGDEPFLKIRNQGIILAEDGRKMSKRWKNVINPDEVVEQYGADTMRIYEMFMGPLEDMKPWNQKGIIGVRRFLEKVYKFIQESPPSLYELRRAGKKALLRSTSYGGQAKKQESDDVDVNVEKLLHKTIKKVTEDIEAIHFNTAISAMMIFVNEISNFKFLPAQFAPARPSRARQAGQISNEVLEKFLIILSPFAPHLTEELWEQLGHQESIFKQSWPAYDKRLVIDKEVTIAIQVNGKLRETMKVERGLSEEDLKLKTYNLPKVRKYVEGRVVKKFIYIKDKLVNLVT